MFSQKRKVPKKRKNPKNNYATGPERSVPARFWDNVKFVFTGQLRTIKKCGHCEPVRTLAWQSPSTFRKFGGDSHVGAYAPPRNDMRFLMVHQ